MGTMTFGGTGGFASVAHPACLARRSARSACFSRSRNSASSSSVMPLCANASATGANVPTAVNGPGSTVFCGKLYLYGGGYPTVRNITQIYDPVSNSWSSGPHLNVARRWFYGSAVDNTAIVAPGGTTTSSVNTNEQLAGCQCP